ncbi:MAG TPA: 2-oxoacid:acceptor oxidoreductase subunit alpha, partial [bacterium]|nr:2-oxoacid:acceptor oxidoreductase subunit alpha [bacterium]
FPTQRQDEIKEFITRLTTKIEKARRELIMVETEFIDDAKVAVLSYGSTSRSARRAVTMARKGGSKAGIVRLLTLWPFPVRAVQRLSEHVDAIIVPEMNQGQLVGEVERHACGRCSVVPLNRFDGAMIEPEEILHAILEVE